MIISISLPWPDWRLSPNSRVYYKTKNEQAQIAKVLAFVAARDQNMSDWEGMDGGLVMVVTAHPPDKRRRDLDNVLASCKAYQDGLCEALHVDDRQIIEERISWGNVVAGGQVVMTLARRGEV